jgi:hypothetical protein
MWGGKVRFLSGLIYPLCDLARVCYLVNCVEWGRDSTFLEFILNQVAFRAW